MKRSEVRNLLSKKRINSAIDPELRFVGMVNEHTGELETGNGSDYAQPEEWDNVRHLVGNMYFAWNGSANTENFDPKVTGVIYLGKFEEDEEE